jgi:uncharacterized membrane protein
MAQMVTETKIEAYSGPLPSPTIIEAYERIAPGTAKAIVSQFEKQGDHRREMERTVIQGELSRSNAGLAAGTLIGLAGMAVAAYALSLGHPATGATIIGTVLAGGVGTFIHGTRQRRKEREDKAKIQVQLLQGQRPR